MRSYIPQTNNRPIVFPCRPARLQELGFFERRSLSMLHQGRLLAVVLAYRIHVLVIVFVHDKTRGKHG